MGDTCMAGTLALLCARFHRRTSLVADTSSSFRDSLLFVESLLRQTPPTDEELYRPLTTDYSSPITDHRPHCPVTQRHLITTIYQLDYPTDVPQTPP